MTDDPTIISAMQLMIAELRGHIDDRLERFTGRLDARLIAIDGRLTTMDERMNGIDARLATLFDEVAAFRQEYMRHTHPGDAA